MKQLLLLSLLFSITSYLFAQCYDTQYQNYSDYNIKNAHRLNFAFPGYLENNVSLQFEGNVFENSEEPLFQTILFRGLWMSGFDPADNLKLSAISFGQGGASDYTHTPAEDWDDVLTPVRCAFFDYIWVIRKTDIEKLKYLFETNQLTQENIPSDIKNWPAKGNPWITEVDIDYDMAPFYDFNSDGIYNPFDGDYPICLVENKDFIPFQFSFNLFSDYTPHVVSQSVAIQAEVHQINYLINCRGNNEAEKSVFSRLKIINKAPTSLINFRVGLWDYTSLGCSDDDYHGCDTLTNSVFTYNKNGIDSTVPCPNGIESIQDYGVISSNIFLNSKLESYIYAIRDLGNDAKQAAPSIRDEFQYFISGKWIDGSDMTKGGDGTDEQGEITKYAFTDLPNDPDGWSMQNINIDSLYNIQTISTFQLTDISPGESNVLDLSAHVIYDSTELTLNLFNQYRSRIMDVQDTYDNLINGNTICDDEIKYCVTDCIWPGDVNLDGVVNGRDIVLEGLLLADETDHGLSRKFTSNDWFPFESFDWGQNYKSFDFKYADINGNGTIDDYDLDYLKENYDKTWKAITEEPRIDAGPEKTNLYQHLSRDSIDLDEASTLISRVFSLRVDLGQPGEILSDPIHGITMRMYADTNLVNSFIQTFPDGTDLYDISNFYGREYGDQLYRADDEFDVSITRTDGNNYEEFERIIQKHSFILREDAKTENEDRRDTIVFEISNIHALNANGDTVQIGVVYDSLIVSNLIYDPDLTTSVLENIDPELHALTVYPNPASQILLIDFKDVFSGQVDIFSITGTLVSSMNIDQKKSYKINLGSIPNGMYLLQAKGSNGDLYAQKFIRQTE